MIITKALRKKLVISLPKNYRKLVVDRLAARGYSVHANTISNVLNGSQNLEVAAEIIKLAREHKDQKAQLEKELEKNLRQL